MAVETEEIPGTQLDTNGAPLNVVNKLFIDIYGYTEINKLEDGNWGRCAVKIQTITPSANETSNSNSFYDGEGFGDTEVTGKRYQLALTGQRYVGNPAQDYIASKQFAIGQALHCRVIWIVNGEAIVSKATLTNIVATGGDAANNQTFSCTIEFNGKPRKVLGLLTMTENVNQRGTYKATVDPSAKPATPATPSEQKPATIAPVIPAKIIDADDEDDSDTKTGQDPTKSTSIPTGGNANPSGSTDSDAKKPTGSDDSDSSNKNVEVNH